MGIYHINEEKFFKTVSFSQLPKDQVGISSLKRILGKLLYNHIRSEFPGLVLRNSKAWLYMLR